MSTTFDLRVELPAALAGPAAAFRFVERFAAHLGAPVGPGDGTPEGELADAERRLGLALPEAMREWYARFGQRWNATPTRRTVRRARTPTASRSPSSTC
ncbi:SMI1/KNR4 family protein [Kitasatospora sp. NBC_01560]|uniref:hypothetical protein n=1 Tax=Kitasatospora sp. NBC_01560 TaxID=2975965 RepID=UPI003866B996